MVQYTEGRELRPAKRAHLTFSHRVQKDPLHELLFSLLPPILSCPRMVRVRSDRRKETT